MKVNYFCSGFDINNAFWPELAERFKSEMDDTKSIVYYTNIKEMCYRLISEVEKVLNESN